MSSWGKHLMCNNILDLCIINLLPSVININQTIKEGITYCSWLNNLCNFNNNQFICNKYIYVWLFNLCFSYLHFFVLSQISLLQTLHNSPESHEWDYLLTCYILYNALLKFHFNNKVIQIVSVNWLGNCCFNQELLWFPPFVSMFLWFLDKNILQDNNKDIKILLS